MIWSGWAFPTCSKMLHEKVWGLQWDQNTPIKEEQFKDRRLIDLALLKQYRLFSLVLQTKQLVYFILLNQIHVGDFLALSCCCLRCYGGCCCCFRK